ncbi:MAG: hypothetical protein L6R38_004942 [Xanthoria sp. 2 TBL-2021]|nr:MAG: hypothetical protein L6R38_004942 [Xanthoria sp. 2 TBL-2021]
MLPEWLSAIIRPPQQVQSVSDEDTLNEVSVPFASPGQLHTVEFPNYGPSGDFDKLPPEIRIMIWGLLLRFPRPVVLTTPHKLSSHDHHKRLCPANRHDCVDDTLICYNRFDPTDINEYKAPRSVLEISLTSKELRKETLSVFFAINTIMLTGIDRLKSLKVSAGHHLKMIRNLRLCWSKYDFSVGGVRVLLQMPALENLEIEINYSSAHLNRAGNLKAARGMTQLCELRGIKELKLVGMDRMRDDNGDWRVIRVEHPDAVGPWLRKQVTKPKLGRHQRAGKVGI